MNRPIPNNPPSAEVLLAALEAADVGVTRVAIRGGALGRERLCPVIARSLGYTLAELVERDALDVVAPHDRPRIAAMVQRAAIAGAPAQVETWFTHRDGHLLPVEMVLHQTTSTDGFDLTIVVQFLGARQRTSAAHAVADRATLVGSLAAGIAHELSNPLTFVGLNVHQLRRALERPDLDRGRLAEIAGELGGGLERVERVVRALAVFAAPARAATAIDVRALVGAALTLVRPSIERVARAEAHFDEVPRVVAEEARLGHAVLAVLLHAITGFDHDDLAGSGSTSWSSDAATRWRSRSATTAARRSGATCRGPACRCRRGPSRSTSAWSWPTPSWSGRAATSRSASASAAA